jgi:hypothetical protein
MVEIRESGKRMPIKGTGEWIGCGSTYPDFMRTKGRSMAAKKGVNGIKAAGERNMNS